jgi:isoleucyl-tRNA synthetase
MTSTKPASRDWGATLFLPKTAFPMKAGLPQLEPRLLERWAKLGLYQRQREAARGRPKFILHDGPPYANGNIHIGTALNKILKDMVTRSQQMLGFDSNYVPGWDCHGLPIEWKIEEEYRAKGQDKDAVPVNEFRKQCRDFAEHWIGVQREEFKRLGVEGDWEHYYSTMAYKAEGTIAAELMKFAMNGALYRGSKPVMWSVVEKTALAEAEVEYHDYTSDTVWVKFPVLPVNYMPPFVGREQPGTPVPEHVNARNRLKGASIVIWTTTPWTLPGNRAIAFSPKIAYGLFEVTSAPEGNWAKAGDRLILAEKLAPNVFKHAKVEGYALLQTVPITDLEGLVCRHPLWPTGKGEEAFLETKDKKYLGTKPYSFVVPLLAGDHVTDEDGTGFVHTAPGHGREDFDIWTASAANAARARHRSRDPLYRRQRRALHQGRAGLRGQAGHRRQGQQGRRQRGGDHGAERRRHADRARAPEAPVPALLALQEACDLPQHAPMVHRHGQGAPPPPLPVLTGRGSG